MRLISVLFVTLVLLVTLAAPSQAGVQKENQLSPDETRERETQRLISLMRSRDEEIRFDAVVRLSALRAAGAREALASASNDPSERVRAAAIAGIGNGGDPSFAPIVGARLLADKSVLVRKSAAYALGKLKGDRTVAALTSALHDKDLEVRGAAAIGLGECEDPAAINPLIEGLSDSSEFVRERSAHALGRYGRASAAAVSILINLLTADPGHGVKLHAAIALGEIGDRSAVPALDSATHDKNPYVSRAAIEALKRIAQTR